jgi:hypothetical protein
MQRSLAKSGRPHLAKEIEHGALQKELDVALIAGTRSSNFVRASASML